MRVRQGAQFSLADRGDAGLASLVEAAERGPNVLARLHGVWGLGQLGAAHRHVGATIVTLLADPEAEVRAQAARVAGDLRIADALEPLSALLADESPRARLQAGIAIGKLGNPAAIPGLLEMLRDNADRDPLLRHAAAMGLTGSGDAEALTAAAEDANPSAQMGVLLAMRRLRLPQIARFLEAADPRLVDEAARAIYDQPIDGAMPALARIVDRPGLSDVAARRAINANFRLGLPEHATAVVRFAARSDASEALRLEAIHCLDAWEKPSGRDRVVGLWRPLEPRTADVVHSALEGSSSLGGLLSGNDQIREAGARLCAKLGLKEVAPVLASLVANLQLAPTTRVGALEALHRMEDDRTAAAVELALRDDSPIVRAGGQSVLAARDAPRALELFDRVMDEGSRVERQSAVATLARLESKEADSRLGGLFDELLAGRLPPDVHLDLLQAAERRGTTELATRLQQYELARPAENPLGKHLECLQGGDSERGRRIYANRAEASCVRCHKLQGRGSEVGPDLSKIGAEKTRDYLLEAIVAPNRRIAKGFETAVIVTTEGLTHVGIIKSEDAESVRLITAEARTITIAKADIDERDKGQSAMPEKLANLLTKSDLRDLVEYLSQLK
jgi:quinoprotein glucose dehydrogenase